MVLVCVCVLYIRYTVKSFEYNEGEEGRRRVKTKIAVEKKKAKRLLKHEI